MVYIFSIIAFLTFFGLASFTIASIIEKEKRATLVALILSITIPGLILLCILLPSIFQTIILIAISFIALLLLLSLLLPFKRKVLGFSPPIEKYDERNTMFSRNEISSKTFLKEEYYKANPDKAKLDKIWQNKPGLLKKNSLNYNAINFAAADATFETIEKLKPWVEKKASVEKQEINANEITNYLKNWSKKLGAIDFGVCELKPHHLYATRGRGKEYGKPVNNRHKYAIAITVEMHMEYLAMGPESPTVMESAQQYLNSGIIAVQISNFISNLGYEARAHIDGNYEVICPLVATDAGLGDIGRMGLLISPKLGPRIRIAVVTTNLPLVLTKKKEDLSIQEFCNICKKCATNCPVDAIPERNKIEINGVQRWQINQEKCFTYWCSSGTDCGRCMSVCPYSHPNTFFHNLIRWGIKKSAYFQHIALWLDHIFYGKKINPKKTPKWMIYKHE